MPNRNHYEVLAIATDATLASIKEAYIKQTMLCRANAEGSSVAQLSELQTAFEVLSDDARRHQYDQALRLTAQAVPSARIGANPASFFRNNADNNVAMPNLAITTGLPTQKLAGSESIKVILVGGDKSGKEAFCRHILPSQSPLSFIGVDFGLVDLNETKFKVYDLAGVNLKNAIASHYCKDSAIILFFNADQSLIDNTLKHFDQGKCSPHQLNYEGSTVTLAVPPFNGSLSPSTSLSANAARQLGHQLLNTLSALVPESALSLQSEHNDDPARRSNSNSCMIC